jgi:hypothetical protein
MTSSRGSDGLKTETRGETSSTVESSKTRDRMRFLELNSSDGAENSVILLEYLHRLL